VERTSRAEAFSDGVFAIAATLLVLEIGIDTPQQLTSSWPAYLAYVTSFLTIGIIWINHHHTMSLIDRVDRTFLFVNVVLLLTIAFLPLPTNLVARYLNKPGERSAVVAYAATLVVMAIVHQVYWQYARRGRRLIGNDAADAALKSVDLAYIPGVPLYGAALVLAFFSPLAAVFLTFAIAAFYLPAAALFDR
jgi:uncharacterized membrane protein